MPDPKPLVAYTFSWVRKQPRTVSELNKVSWSRRQIAMITVFAKAQDAEIIRTIAGTSTSREKAFAMTEMFRSGVATAYERGADLVLADIVELLSRAPLGSLADCIEALDGVQVDIWDAGLGRLWRSFDTRERLQLQLLAGRVQVSRSKPIKAGLSYDKRKRKAPPPGNGLHGNMSARRNADTFAKRHAGFVKSEAAKLAPGKKLSPTSVARALNDAGIPTRRGGQWSHNAAKDLMKRQRALGILRD